MLSTNHSSWPFATAIFLLATNAFATDYSAGFNMDVHGLHNNNIRLVQNDKTAVSGIVAVPTIDLAAQTETSKIALDSIFSSSRYDDSDFNTDDQNINLSLLKQFETASIGLNAGVLRDSTLTSELLGSGRISNKAERSEQYSASPYATLLINEKNTLSLRGSYLVRDYHSRDYIGYEDWGASLDWTHQINERWMVDAVVQYDHYSSDSVNINVPSSPFFSFPFIYPPGYFGTQSYSSESTTKGGQLGATYVFSETASLSALFGISHSKTEYPVKDPNNLCDTSVSIIAPLCSLQSNTDRITTAVVKWNWANEVNQVTLNLTKSQQPTSNGYAIDATTISSNWDYHLTELDRFSLNLSGTRNRELGSNDSPRNSSEANRDYIEGTLGYHRQLTETWFIDTSYEYQYQKYKENDYRANANIISLGVSYHPQVKHWSR